MTDGLIGAAKRAPNTTAVVCGGRALTYAELAHEVERLASRLSGRRRVAVILRNDPELLTVVLAGIRAGATVMVLDPAWPAETRNQILDAHAPDLLIADATDIPGIENAVQQPSANAQFLMGFTSGTTGTPKAFVRTQASWQATFAAAGREFGDLAGSGELAPGPLCHSLTLYAAIETLEAGGTIYLQPHVDAAACVDILRDGRVRSIACVPSMLDLLCAAAITPVDTPFAIVCAGAKLSAGLRKIIATTFPAARVFEYYGASELSFISVAHPDDQPPPDSVGRAFDSVKLAVRRDDGANAAVGEVGTVWVQSPMISDGYVGPTDDSGFRQIDGWATVGDRGHLDAAGFLYLAGRENEMLISGGLNIYPQEIESVLAGVPGVTAVAVIGIADARWGQVVGAVVEGTCTQADLMAACERTLARAKLPRRWFRIADMPRTTSGKIARAKLTEMLPSLETLS